MIAYFLGGCAIYGIVLFVLVMPVSYTHLDVYKRQERKMTYISELGAFSDVDEFFLMAACRHQIISNSSYSTWAAYLNPNPEKVVIMPEYKGCEQIRLKEWIVL